jgi:hypothetical protein
MHHRYTVHVCLCGSGTGYSFEHNGYGLADPRRGHRRSNSLREDSCSRRPIAPPSRWAGPDHVRGVDYQHSNRIAHVQSGQDIGTGGLNW